MALRRPPTTFSDSIDAADLAANSVTSSELADNAVDTAAIADNAVLTAKIADSSSTTTGITPAKIAENAVTSAKIATGAVIADGIGAGAVVAAGLGAGAVTAPALGDVIEVKPHIIPGVLYPAVANIMVDGTTALSAVTTGPNSSTVASSKYGTVQSDGRMYYYTDIKGSKPIKDPRIGAHFGSQRHQFSSLQLLEQETAIYGQDVKSLDGREWARATGTINTYNLDWGETVQFDAFLDTYFYEITGYFNKINLIGLTWQNNSSYGLKYAVNTSSYTTAGASDDFNNSAHSPLKLRYVNAGSVLNIPITATLGINTVKISTGAPIYGIELIAQDTTSATTRNQMQIPSQNVVSYGKKFTVAATPNFNPFAESQTGAAVAIGNTTSHGKLAGGWSGTGATYFDDTLDTATSLGLAAWVTGGNYYRPVNGGRVVRWVDSSGNIKTSVNMMPPCATALNAGSDASLPTSHAWTTVYQPKIKSGALDHSQAEVAKTYNFREFGNGAANQGQAGAYADASMLSASADDIAYVMDDGLTGFSASNVQAGTTGINHTNNDNLKMYITFIGTGFTVELRSNGTGNDHYDKYVDGVQVQDGGINRTANVVVRETLAQNLPYGSHVIILQRGAETPNVFNEIYKNFTFHQPKMPPIPEDAVVLSDYMLMADFVPATSVDAGAMSKGVRYNHATRDIFYDSGAAITYNQGYTGDGYQYVSLYNNNAASESKITAFGTAYGQHYWRGTNRPANTQARLDGANYTYVVGDLYDSGGEWDDTNDDGTLSKVGAAAFGAFGIKNQVLGNHTFGDKLVSGGGESGKYNSWCAYEVATPIHTSSHYQTFETPFLNELVGGDRNMEQNNLIVTADGKTWDEVTRDVSYIGNIVVQSTTDTETDYATFVVVDEWRGKVDGSNMGNKDFAIAYDHLICLKDGQYKAQAQGRTNGTGEHTAWMINGSQIYTAYSNLTAMQFNVQIVMNLKRGDYIQLQGEFGVSARNYNQFSITRL